LAIGVAAPIPVQPYADDSSSSSSSSSSSCSSTDSELLAASKKWQKLMEKHRKIL
jgi:hypothetical protein